MNDRIDTARAAYIEAIKREQGATLPGDDWHRLRECSDRAREAFIVELRARPLDGARTT